MSQNTVEVTFDGSLMYTSNGVGYSASVGYIIREMETGKVLAEVGENISDRIYLQNIGPTYVEYCALIEGLRKAKEIVDVSEYGVRIRGDNLSVLRCVSEKEHNSSVHLDGMVDDAKAELSEFSGMVEFDKITVNPADKLAGNSHRRDLHPLASPEP